MHTVWTSQIIISHVENIKVYIYKIYCINIHDTRGILSRKQCIVNLDCRHHGHVALLLLL